MDGGFLVLQEDVSLLFYCLSVHVHTKPNSPHRYVEAVESLFESTELIFTASEDAYRFLVQQPHAHLARIRALDLAFTHFKDHLFLQSIAPRHPRINDDDSGSTATTKTVPVGWDVWMPLAVAVRERMPAMRSLRVTLSPPGARAEVFVDVLREWEREGHGWVTERAEGVVYLELGRRRRKVAAGDVADESAVVPLVSGLDADGNKVIAG